MYLNYLHEVYFGENRNIKEMQKCISKFRKDLFSYRLGARLNTHPEIKRFNRLVEDEFGFKAFCLYIDPQKVINAYTIPISMNFKALTLENNTMSNLIVKKNGYKFKKQADYCGFVCIYRGILADKRFTDREILAVILHEIGHNFEAAISNYQCALNNTRVILYLIKVIYNLFSSSNIIAALKQAIMAPVYLTGTYNKLSKILDDALYKNFPNFYHLCDTFQAFLSAIQYPYIKVLEFIGRIISLPYVPIKLLLKLNPINLIISFSTGGFRGEKMADNFPTMYGYGPDIASATTKIRDNDFIGRVKIPLVSPLIGIFENTYRLLLSLPDEHPVTITRIKDQADYLRKELNREDFDPKFKKEIMSQIDDIDKQLDDLLSINYEGAISDYNYTNHLYQLMIYKIFGGDPLDLYYKWSGDDIHADVQDVYDTKMNESTKEFIRTMKKIRLK